MEVQDHYVFILSVQKHMRYKNIPIQCHLSRQSKQTQVKNTCREQNFRLRSANRKTDDQTNIDLEDEKNLLQKSQN